MKITESSIRQYIRNLLMETFYVQPGGVAMTRDQFEKQSGNKGIAATIPADTPQIDRSFPVKLAMAAKEEYEGMLQDDPETFELIKQKVFPVAFGFTYDELLENLTFTQSDLKYINIDIKKELRDKTNFNQMMMTLESFMPDTVAYLRHLVTATDDFSRDESRAQFTTLDPGEGRVFYNSMLTIFFTPPDKAGNIGMGKSLIDYVIDKIMSSLLQVKNMTPIEFSNKFYPEFYKIIDVHFKNNPLIANNAQALKPIRDAYLDSIEYVLTELIAELNFEFLYWGGGKDLTSKNPEDLLLFLPDDRALLAKHIKIARKLDAEDPWWDFKTYLGDIYRPDSHTYSNSPELRSMPDYYQMKYSINPKLAGVAGSEIKKKINYRLWDNIYFGVGFSNENVDIPDDLAYGGVSELWEKS